MIGKLRGIVDEVGEDYLVLDVGGVGYTVFAGKRTLMQMPMPGEMAAVYTETHVREDHIHLYGFISKQERECFRILTTVQGVGVKMALAILSLYGAGELARILAAQDKSALTAVSGVGPKLAERIITELKSKAHLIPSDFTVSGSAAAPPAIAVETGAKKSGKSGKKSAAAAAVAVKPAVDFSADAVSALAHLGFGRAEAFAAVSRFLHHTPDASLDEIIKHSLQELAA